ncbi:hypothetical protein [Williamsia maris]|uniref:RDD family protein n=1 Tax=Williamsia maris TaxID=72806 RepID=A0ABT1H9Z4_9NOCA|nr:hypothetical protein [Williamsia maris]MCP2174782.1 hypothetical protein [Williamsia maris]
MTRTEADTVKSIRLLGTTWQRRGFRYWSRRTGLLLLWLAVFALSMWVVGLLFKVVITDRDADTSLRGVALGVMSVAVLSSFAWGFSLMRRSDAEKKLGVPMIVRSGTAVDDQRRAAWQGYGIGLVAAPLILLGQLFFVGVLAALVLSLMQRHISVEEFEAATGRKAPPRVKKQRRLGQRRQR